MFFTLSGICFIFICSKNKGTINSFEIRINAQKPIEISIIYPWFNYEDSTVNFQIETHSKKRLTKVTWASNKGGSGICALDLGIEKYYQNHPLPEKLIWFGKVKIKPGKNIVTFTATDVANNKASVGSDEFSFDKIVRPVVATPYIPKLGDPTYIPRITTSNDGPYYAAIEIVSDPGESYVYGDDGNLWGTTPLKMSDEGVLNIFGFPDDSPRKISITLKQRAYKDTKHTFTIYPKYISCSISGDNRLCRIQKTMIAFRQYQRVLVVMQLGEGE